MRFITKAMGHSNQKGQAVLEYVLLLVVIVAIAITVMSYVAGATQRFFQNYYGAYFSCLLETGELPSLGVDGRYETECDDLYEPFTIADGRGPIDSGVGGNNSGSGNTGNDPDQDGKSPNNQSSSSGSGRNSAAAGSSEAGSGPGGGGIGFGSSGRQQKVPLSKADGAGGDDEGGDEGSAGYNNFRRPGDFGSDGSGRSQYVPIYGSLGEQEQEEQQNADVVKATAPESTEQALRAKRVPAKAEKKSDENVEVDEELGLPDFLRYLIIAAIIIIILTFFGGQVLQFQKSKD